MSVPLKGGSPFTEKEYQQGESILREYFLVRGYGRATAERSAEIDTRANQARVFYSVDPGPLTFFGSTSIEGTRDIKPYIVAREIVYKQGELFSPKKIADSRRKITRASEVATGFAASQVSQQLSQALGLEEMGIELRQTGSGAGVGSYVGRDTYATFSQDFSQQGGQRVDLEHYITRHFEVDTDTTSRGDRGADVLWSTNY